MGEDLKLTPPPSAPEPRVDVPKEKFGPRQGRKGHGGFDAGVWPKNPPFTVCKRSPTHYFLIGTVSAVTHKRIMDATEDRVFPWTEYLARRWGPGVYRIQDSGAVSARDKVAYFLVPESLAHLFGDPEASTTNPPQGSAEPEGDEPEGSAEDIDPLERFESELARVDRIKERLGIKPPAPPPPPKPSLLEVLTNPANVPSIMATLQQVLGGGRPSINPPAAAPANGAAAKWAELGRHYESLGVTPEMMIAELEANLARQAEAMAQQAAKPEREP